jgi:hypothetical protein
MIAKITSLSPIQIQPIWETLVHNAMKHFLAILTVLLLAPQAALTAAERQPFVEAIPAWVNAESWSRVVQFTSQPVISTNVHMEQRFASANGRRIAIRRQPFGQPPELWVCDLVHQGAE